jgi:hypothetical protein
MSRRADLTQAATASSPAGQIFVAASGISGLAWASPAWAAPAVAAIVIQEWNMQLRSLALAGAVCLAGSASPLAARASEMSNEVAIGFAIAPVPLHITDQNRTLVGLGSYLVNAVGGCNDCHTNPPYAAGGNPFLGQPKKFNAAQYLSGGTSFGNGIVSRDLTPFRNGMPAGLTLAQFKHVLLTGEDPLRPGKLLQVMPWPIYQSMTAFDMTAIYTYLSVIPPLQPGK